VTTDRPSPLIADCGGLIETIALSLPAAWFADAGIGFTVSPLVPIGNLLLTLPRNVAVPLLVDRPCLAAARSWLDRLAVTCQVDLVTLDEPGTVPHPWIQDMFHVRLRADALTPELVSSGESAMSQALAARLGFATAISDVILPGGNQLVGPDYRLVGHASLQGGAESARSAPATLSRRWLRIEALDPRAVFSFGYRPEDLGETVQPDLSQTGSGPAIAARNIHQCGFHVDQFVSITGLRRDGRPLLLVADPEAGDMRYPRAAEELKRKLDASALSLARQGFAILRNPVPVLPTIDTNKCLPRLYNNVLLENVTRNGETQPLVWVPHFGDLELLADFDAENRRIWESLGFRAIGVLGFSHLASRNGALRCATKVIMRGL